MRSLLRILGALSLVLAASAATGYVAWTLTGDLDESVGAAAIALIAIGCVLSVVMHIWFRQQRWQRTLAKLSKAQKLDG